MFTYTYIPLYIISNYKQDILTTTFGGFPQCVLSQQNILLRVLCILYVCVYVCCMYVCVYVVGVKLTWKVD